MKLQDLSIKLYADGADIDGMLEMYHKGIVSGFTTNPTLMKKAGITDYAAFAKKAVAAIPEMSLSFEVFSDDFDSMYKEAKIIRCKMWWMCSNLALTVIFLCLQEGYPTRALMQQS